MIRKAIIKGSIFCILLAIVISILNSIFVIKIDHRSKLIQGLYENTDDQYDVVLLGSSHMNGGIDPNILWSKYGISSFNYGTGGQPIDVTYYLLKEVLKKHKNPIVVVDLYYLGATDEFGSEGYVRYVLDSMRLSQNKMEAIINTTPKDQWASFLFPMIKYHNRWKELNEQDFSFNIGSSYYAKGFSAGNEMYGENRKGYTCTKEIGTIPPKTERYLYKIIDLSKKEGFKLIFTNAPYDYDSTAGSNNWNKEPAKMFNKVSEIAKDNNITFINYCDKFEEIGFNFKTDMNNEGHLNIWGANKVTTNLGEFLKENYNLVDHRSDIRYAKWNSDYKRYSETNVAAMEQKK
ncbi:hypothetical protein [Clostridium sp. 'White wine YQ']|uniref:hypothetical protein n=1 Tax=Clostridium sp. 'White wine YQ' TaxID=3027474 RepID=UPI00236500E1|nr:hypothetical protein [Clostridium sp. 'White wine YQ']MDD7795332.1 hypothetical protein [Clostridium sp. 'White wine YQ']